MRAAADNDFAFGLDLAAVGERDAGGDSMIVDEKASDDSAGEDVDAGEIERFVGVLSAAIFPVFGPRGDTQSIAGV